MGKMRLVVAEGGNALLLAALVGAVMSSRCPSLCLAAVAPGTKATAAEGLTDWQLSDKGDHAILKFDGTEPEPWQLPQDWKNADGTVNQEVIVAQQKKRVAAIARQLGARFQTVETPHYLIVSDAGPDALTFAQSGEVLHAGILKLLGLDAKTRTWDGKCLVMIFRTEAVFLRHAKEFDRHDVRLEQEWGAATRRPNHSYAAWESRPPGEPQLVHVCVAAEDIGKNPRDLQDTLAHEATHAFFFTYNKPGKLPLWLHEGLAQTMTVAMRKEARTPKVCITRKFVAQKGALGEVLNASWGQGMTVYPFAVSYCLVDFLLLSGQPKLRVLLDKLDNGATLDAALQDSYGFGQEEFQRRWLTYTQEYLPRHP